MCLFFFLIFWCCCCCFCCIFVGNFLFCFWYFCNLFMDVNAEFYFGCRSFLLFFRVVTVCVEVLFVFAVNAYVFWQLKLICTKWNVIIVHYLRLLSNGSTCVQHNILFYFFVYQVCIFFILFYSMFFCFFRFYYRVM